MSATIYSMGASNNRNLPTGTLRWYAALVALLALSAFALVAWIESRTWRDLNRLQPALSAAGRESFSLGMNLRLAIVRMDAALLRYQLSENETEREAFHRQLRQISETIGYAKPHLTTAREQQLLGEIESRFQHYLSQTAPLLERGVRGIRRDTAAQVQQSIAHASAALVSLTDQLVDAQSSALSHLFGTAQSAMGSVQSRTRWSLLLFAALVCAMAALAYPALVGRLRSRLNQSQALVERQEKLASLGVLAAGIAHEIRNPLTAIKFRIFSLKSSLELAENEDLSVINGEIHRLEHLVSDFLDFARPTAPGLAPLPVSQLLEETANLLKPEIQKQNIDLVLDVRDSLIVRADKQQLRQVLINLVQNAAQSMYGSGTITLRARQGGSSLLKRSEPMVILEVQDTGKGILPEIEKRLFDPFFSTKEGGTGLGLSIAERIVQAHGGFIQYLTEPNRGTTFSIMLPRI
jgi:signal transduction histidine kinase